jgi:hypothetical protein
VRDIALYLADLTRAAAVAGPGQWALLTQIGPGPDTASTTLDAKTIAELRAALEDRDRQLRLMQRETARLRATSPAENPAAQEQPA